MTKARNGAHFRTTTELHLTVPNDESKFPNLRYRKRFFGNEGKPANLKPQLAG